MKKNVNLLLTVLFVVFLFGFCLLFLILPDREFSDNENRNLKQFPPFSIDSVLSGKWMTDLEDYVTDQFPFRDTWMAANSVIKAALLKKDINGVYLGRDGYLLEVFNEVEEKVTDRQVSAFNKFASYHPDDGVRYFFALVPNSLYTLSDKLPAYAQNIDQKEYIEDFYARLEGGFFTTVDLTEPLAAHKDEYIYYRTDHHWTSLGAYYGYAALAQAMGLTPSSLSDYTVTEVTDEFKGTFFSKGNFPVKADTISRFDRTAPVSLTAWGDDGVRKDSIYDESFLSVKDKYCYFLGGNPAHYTVETSAGTGKTLVLIKDSYSHSLLPFFLEHYSVIHMLDLRYINKNINDYIDELEPDDVLILYNVVTFASDTNVNKLAFAPSSENQS